MIGSEVRIRDLDKRFGDAHVLKNVALDVKKGEFFSLLGPSGCGKTTLLRIIAGFESPDQGTVLLDDRDVLALPPNRRQVNTVFQSYALFPHLSVFENVAFPLRLRRLGASEVERKVNDYLSLVKLQGHEQKKPAQLSGGQKQRVAIARALVNEPRVLLLDEPLSALDAKLRQHMLIELDAIHDKIGITFIYVTHDQQEALGVSDRVAVMNDGIIHQIGTPSQIYESPADHFVATFIGETNLFEGVAVESEGGMVTAEVNGMGRVRVTTDSKVTAGERLRLTVRPEKIRVGHGRPESLSRDYNLLEGRVDEIIYSGFLSKIFVQTPFPAPLRVFQQHAKFTEEGPGIRWKDQVFLWWHADDGYIVEAAR